MVCKFESSKQSVLLQHFSSLVDHSKHFYTTSNIHPFIHTHTHTALRSLYSASELMGFSVLPRDTLTHGPEKLGIKPQTVQLVADRFPF